MAEDDEQYLRELAFPEDAWVLDGPPFYTATEVADHFGVTAGGVRSLAERGEFPGALLLSARSGWRIPRSGLIAYLARLRRETTVRYMMTREAMEKEDKKKKKRDEGKPE
jgi:Helix-turn-helix domain